MQELNSRSCLGIKINAETEAEIKYSDIYAIEYIGLGLIHDFTASVGGLISGRNLEVMFFPDCHCSRVGHFL